MRIIGGEFGGMRIEAPTGRDTRPTVDRVREAMASSAMALIAYDIEECNVLDGFGGSGALSLELISRGAAFATIFEADSKAVLVIRSNVMVLGVTQRVKLMKGDSLRLASRKALVGAPFHIVMLDPPYAMDIADVGKFIKDLIRSGNLANNALIVYEHDKKSPGLELDELELLKEKRYGGTAVDSLRYVKSEKNV